MIVKSIQKLNKNEYKVFFDECEEVFFDETILDLGIILNKKIDIKKAREYNKIIKEYYSLINKIKYRKKSEKEVRDYLTNKKISSEDAEKIITKLKKVSLLNDEVFLHAFISDKINFSKYGEEKIRMELLKRGFSEEEINEKLSQVDNNIWIEKINKEIKLYIKGNITSSKKALKEKILSSLINKGYKYEDILRELKTHDFPESKEILMKNYMKLIKRYNEEEVVKKLIQRGFSYEEIKNIKF